MTQRKLYTKMRNLTFASCTNIEESIEDLRYNNVVIATDADLDGMHIRLLLVTLQFFPELIKEGHLYI